MKMQSAKLLGAISSVLMMAAIPATAATFQFDKLSGTPNAGDFLPDGTKGSDWFQVTGNDVASSNDGSPLGGFLKYTNGGITVKVTASYKLNGVGSDIVATVVQDNGDPVPGKAGLGVYSASPFVTSDDNITGKVASRIETLTLDFGRTVHITDFGFNAEGHTPLTTSETYLLNGVQKTFAGPDVYTGQIFSFTFDSAKSGQQFYLGSVVATVPDGGATLTLLGLSFIGFGASRRFMLKK